MRYHMKVALVHLSDLHLKQNEDIDVNLFCDFLKNKFDSKTQLILCWTGDMTHNGSETQFEKFENLLNKIFALLNSYYENNVIFMPVPGNHDIDLSGNFRNYKSIQDAIHSKDIDVIEKQYREEFLYCAPALNFCKKFDCFKTSNIFDCKKFIFGDVHLNFVLINTSPFSSKKHEDKDFHYFTKSEDLPNLTKNDNKTITFVLSHHRADWFEEESEKVFNDYIKDKSSVYIHGHDHDINTMQVYQKNEQHLTLCGGQMEISHNKLIGEFNILAFDTNDAFVMTNYSVKFNKEFEKFICDFNGEFEVVNKLKLRLFNKKFISRFFSVDDLFAGFDIRKLFVMPLLDPIFSENSQLFEFSDVIDFFEKNKSIHLTGDSGQSKTTIAKMIFNYYLGSKWIIYFDEKNLNANNFSSSLKETFFEQYDGDEELFKVFNEANKDDKILILDGLENLNTSTKIENFKNFKQKFGYVVLTSIDKDDKNIIDENEDILKNYIIYRSLGISLKQREMLITKICLNKDIDNEEIIQKIISSVEASLALSSSLDLTSPTMIILLTNEIIDKKMYEERRTSDAFSIVFEYNVNNLLVKCGKKAELSAYNLVLSELAYSVFKKHSEIYFCSEDILISLKEAKKHHSHIDFDFQHAMDVFTKSNIIVKTKSDSYKFSRNSFLSYYAAKKICSNIKKGITDDIKFILDDITYGLNSDIFLFVIYIHKDLEIISSVSKKLNDALKDIPEINFEEKNILILKKETNFPAENIKQLETRQQLVQRLDSNEKARMKKNAKKEEKIFEKIEYSSLMNSVLTATKLIEILSKVVSGFDEDIEDDLRKVYLDQVLKSSLKILFLISDFDKDTSDFFESQFETNKVLLIKQLEERDERAEEIEKIKKLTYADYLYRKITTMILNFLTSISNICISQISIPLVDSISNDVYFYAIFKLCAYERSGKYERFKNVLSYVFLNKKDCDLQLTRRLVRMYIIKNGLKNDRIKEIAKIASMRPEFLMKFNSSFIEYNKFLKK